MDKTKVLIVDDSSFMRKIIKDILESQPDIEVVDSARNGKDALEKVIKLQPDVVTMDVEMPVMDGLTALKEIMEANPVPVVMVSSLTSEGAEVTLKALEYGAVEFIAKPGGSISLKMEDIKDQIIEKIRIASKSKPRRIILEKRIIQTPTVRKETPVPPASVQQKKTVLPFPVILIGTSTGGPRALHKVMDDLSSNINAPVFIVQHMPATFTKSLAMRLDSISKFSVKEAEDGDIVKPGHAYLAPGGQQMGVIYTDGILKVKLTKEEPVNGHRPSVDYLFNSFAKYNFSKVIAVIMTGMGYDGRDGMVKLNAQGAVTIAESEETCVVYGMPKAAVEANAVDVKVPLDNIAFEILNAYKNMTR